MTQTSPALSHGTWAKRNDNGRTRFTYRHPMHVGQEVHLVRQRGTSALHFDGRLYGVRSRGSCGHSEEVLRARTDLTHAIEAEMLRRLDEARRIKAHGGMALAGARALGAGPMTLGIALDAYREVALGPGRVMAHGSAYLMDQTIRLAEAVLGRDLPVDALLDKDCVLRFILALKRGGIEAAASDPAQAFARPHPTKRSKSRGVSQTGVNGHLRRLRSIFTKLGVVRAPNGQPLVPENPLVILRRNNRTLFAPDDSAAPEMTELRHQQMVAVADAVEADLRSPTTKSGAVARRNARTAAEWWPKGGVLKTFLLLIRFTGRRSGAIRRLQRRNILLTAGEAVARARTCKDFNAQRSMTDAALREIEATWLHGAIWFEGIKDKHKPGSARDTIIPLTEQQSIALGAYLEAMPDKSPDAWLFPAHRATDSTWAVKDRGVCNDAGAVTKREIREWFRALRARTGHKKTPKEGWHAYRRMFAGERLGVVARDVVDVFVGWKRIARDQGTQARYTLISPSTLLELAYFTPKGRSVAGIGTRTGVEVDLPADVRAAMERALQAA